MQPWDPIHTAGGCCGEVGGWVLPVPNNHHEVTLKQAGPDNQVRRTHHMSSFKSRKKMFCGSLNPLCAIAMMKWSCG